MFKNFQPDMLIFQVLGFYITIVIHYAALAYLAKKQGDLSDYTEERNTLNPIVHTDLIGTIVMPAVSFTFGLPLLLGWGKAYFPNISFFKDAGKSIKIIYGGATIISFVAGIVSIFGAALCAVLTAGITEPSFLSQAFKFFQSAGMTLFLLSVFWLLPFPGSAGWFLLIHSIKSEYAEKLEANAGYFQIGLLLLLLVGALGFIFTPFMALLNLIYSTFVSILMNFV